ncbi:unnamed protein product [Ostreobium quekettii]|uniref:Uncharacterized protein n=1 Tax=Ostreobium quekettii TaxID=121088 RepID=A0A8S1J2S0_9CHLO|nr:unnamed protein product [Ostreobium quekettii]
MNEALQRRDTTAGIPRPELFSHFDCRGEQHVFGIRYGLLLDALSVFGTMYGMQELQMRYPGPERELILEMSEGPGGNPSCMYARLDTVDVAPPRDLGDYIKDPLSFFHIQGSVLKEATDDLEWPHGAVFVSLDSCNGISLSSEGTGDLQVELPMDRVSGFQCGVPRLSWPYRWRQLHTAFSKIPQDKGDQGVSTKVTIDANGLMKVTHMVNLRAMLEGGGNGAAAERQVRLNGSLVHFIDSKVIRQLPCSWVAMASRVLAPVARGDRNTLWDCVCIYWRHCRGSFDSNVACPLCHSFTSLSSHLCIDELPSTAKSTAMLARCQCELVLLTSTAAVQILSISIVTIILYRTRQ